MQQTIKDRIINIYKGLKKYHSLNFSRKELIDYLTNSYKFNCLYSDWQSSEYNLSTQPTAFLAKNKKNLQDLTICTKKERDIHAKLLKQETLKQKYGVINPMYSETIKDKLKTNNIQKYGVSNVFQNEDVKKKIKETNKRKLGVYYPTQSEKVLNKRVKTYKKRYGVSNPQKNQTIKDKTKLTCQRKYGFNNPSKSLRVVKKILETKTKKGLITTLPTGNTISRYADINNKAQAWATKIYKVYGKKAYYDWVDLGISPRKIGPNELEKKLISITGLSFYNKSPLKKSKYRPDFKLTDQVYLDIDGLYWHSVHENSTVSKNYHYLKRLSYEAEGKTLIQIREHELNFKSEIIKSMIYKIIKPESFTKLVARKCKIADLSAKEVSDFVEANHLQGKGKSCKGIGLFYNSELVMVLSYKKALKKVGESLTYEIDRLCSKLYTYIVGGFSKLLSALQKSINLPFILKTACDLRYSTGKTYESLGFSFYKEGVSFCWTDFIKTYHRLKVTKNKLAHELGLVKLWDAGQRYYVISFN